MGAVCVDADLDARAEALDQVVERLWWAAHHAVLANTLGADYEVPAALAFLGEVVNRDPIQPCRPAAASRTL